MQGIKFGTDGWRAIVADDFTFANVRSVAQGIAYYISGQQLGKKGVVIGYDNRFLSEKFALTCARVMMGNGIKVYFPPAGIPTPVTAFLVRHLTAGGAVMITASHNPPEYNGIKFIPHYAGPAMPDVTDEIEKEINRVLNGARVYELPVQEGITLGLWEEVSPYEAYRESIFSLLKRGAFAETMKVVVDPMFGVGAGYLPSLLKELNVETVTIHDKRDPLFGGAVPEPTAVHLNELAARVKAEKAILGLALDGDADRFGIVDEEGRFVSPNRVLALVLNYLLATRAHRGPVARTVATTHRLDQVAAAYGLKVLETPVGFKYIGECLREQGAILGGEESGGMSIIGHVPEKDGILACMLVTEMVAATGKTLSQLEQELTSIYKPLVSQRVDLPYNVNEREEVLERLQEYNPRNVAGFKVDRIMTGDGKKVLLENGSWFLLRSSGTEPLFRLYVEAPDTETMSAIEREVREQLGV